jgi:hypothetical protein
MATHLSAVDNSFLSLERAGAESTGNDRDLAG